MQDRLKMAGIGFVATLLVLAGAYFVYWKLSSAPCATPAAAPTTPAAPNAQPAKKPEENKSQPRSQVQLGNEKGAGNEAIPLTKPASPRPSSSTETMTAAATAPKPSARTVRPAADRGRIDDPAHYASIAGRVLDEQGNPVPGANVTVIATGSDSETEADYASAFSDKNHLFTTRSNEHGVYNIDGIRYKGIAVVRADAEGAEAGFSAHTGEIQVRAKSGDALDSVDVRMTAGIALRGTVAGPNGPVTDALVNAVAYLPATGRFQESIGGGHVARTDSAGAFQIVFADRGIAALEVTMGDNQQALFQDVPVGSPEPVALHLPQPAALRGHVVLGGGEDAAGATVVLTKKWLQLAVPGTSVAAGPYVEGTGPVFTATVGTDGSYAINTVDPGSRYEVYVRSDAKSLTEKQEIGPFAPGETKEWDYTAENEVTFRGRVNGAATTMPIGGAFVYCGKKGEENLPSMTVVQTQKDGSYESRVSGGAGVYLVTPHYMATGPDFASPWTKEIACQAGGVYEVDLVLPEPCTLPIRVLDEGGMPVPGADVAVATVMAGTVITSDTIGATDDQGRFVCTMLAPETETWLTINKPGSPPVRTLSHVGRPGEVFSEEIVTMAATGGVRGMAVGPDGTPLARIGIAVIPETENPATARPLLTVTNDQGFFEVARGIPGPTVTLRLVLQVDAVPPPTAVVGPIQCLVGQVTELGQVVFMPQQ